MKQQKTLLRQLRRSRDLTLDVVALRTGLNVSTISRAERGLITPSDETLETLARFFSVPKDELLRPAVSCAEVA